MIRSYADILLGATQEDLNSLIEELLREIKCGWGDEIVPCLRRKIWDLNFEADHARDESLDELVDLQLKIEKLQKDKRYWKGRYWKEKKQNSNRLF